MEAYLKKIATINDNITTLIILKALVLDLLVDQLKLMLKLFEVNFLLDNSGFFWWEFGYFLLEDYGEIKAVRS